jgi:ferric-dicitrate binding protein FerR (iron transport regulator)
MKPSQLVQNATCLLRASLSAESGMPERDMLASYAKFQAALAGHTEQAKHVSELPRSVRRRWAGALGALGLVSAAGVAAWLYRQPTPKVSSLAAIGHASPLAVRGRGMIVDGEGTQRAFSEGVRLPSGNGARLSTTEVTVLNLEHRWMVDLHADSTLVLAERQARQVFGLERGTFHAKVEKLAPEQRFIVRTADAEVSVRGTDFTVEVLPKAVACKTAQGEVFSATRVTVREGAVSVLVSGVDHAVGPGEQFPNCLTVQAPLATASASSKPASSAKPVALSLAEQNDLFANAMQLKRSGDAAGALGKLDELIRRAPQTPLLENAMAEKMRLLAKGNPDQAVRVAVEYKRRFPNGFSTAEADALIGSSR